MSKRVIVNTEARTRAQAAELAHALAQFSHRGLHREAILLRLAFDGLSLIGIIHWTLDDLIASTTSASPTPSARLRAADDLDRLAVGPASCPIVGFRISLHDSVERHVEHLRRAHWRTYGTREVLSGRPAFPSREFDGEAAATPRAAQRWINKACQTANIPPFTLRQACAIGRAFHSAFSRAREPEDGAALAVAVERFRRTFPSFDASDWDDVRGATALRLLQLGRDRGRPVDCSTPGLISQVLRGIVIDHHRRNGRSPERSGWTIDTLRPRGGGNVASWQSEERITAGGKRLIREAASRLRGRERRVLRLRLGLKLGRLAWCEPHSLRKTADVMRLPVSAVRRIESAAMKKVASYLRASGGRASLVHETISIDGVQAGAVDTAGNRHDDNDDL